MDKELLVHIHNGILLSHERNTFSVLMRLVNLEPIIESEVSQKGKDKCCMLTHIYGIWKNGTKNLFSGKQWRNRHRE